MFRNSLIFRSWTQGIKDSVFKTFQVKEQSLPLTLSLLDFTKNPEESLNSVIVRSDQDLGGYSTALLTSEKGESANKKCANFHGILNLDPPQNDPNVKYSGWAMFRTKHKNNFDHRISYLFNSLGNYRWDLSPYQALKLRIKADHRKYFLNIQIDDPQKFNLFQHRIFAQKPGQWETLYIPLDDFVLTNKGRVLKQHHGELNRDKVKSVGIGILDRQYGPYSICIESIEAITDNDYLKAIRESRVEGKREEDWEKKLEKKDYIEIE